MIFQQCIENVFFLLKKYCPFLWKNFLKDYYFIKCLKFFIKDKLILSNKSGFKPTDSCIIQLLSITHEINKSFDVGLEIRSVFLDISKAIDKV